MLDIETLRQVPLFAKLPADRLRWLSERGKEVWLQPGEIHRAEGDRAEHVFVLLQGEVQVTKREGNQQVLLATYKPKTLFGELPILTGDPYFWASGRATATCQIFELGKEDFWQLLSSCSCVMTSILSTMAKRMLEVQSISQYREKLVALGTLASGLAHELNNPASAAQRATGRLQETFQVLQPITLTLSQQVSEDQQAFLLDLQQEVRRRATTAVRLDPITQSDREDEVIEWLESHGIQNCWKIAPTLVAAGLDIDWLANVAQRLPPRCFNEVLTWLEATLTGIGLLNELEHCTERISKLVQAVKDYSYMDQAPLQEIDIHEGLESTLTILGYKLNKQDVTVIRDYDPHLPRITAYGNELNQVWTNLIDNAIDALEGGNGKLVSSVNGRQDSTPSIWIRTRRENEMVLVEIADNGPGIPSEVQSHLFEPFFTTKGVGQGTGLGLHIAYRVVVGEHQGDIHVLSQPGDTRFQIRLPLQLS